MTDNDDESLNYVYRSTHWDQARIDACRAYCETPGVHPGAANIIFMLCTEVERLKEENRDLRFEKG